MRLYILLSFIGLITLSASAQSPLLLIDFENQQGINTATGIKGKAFDLGEVNGRIALGVKNPLKDKDTFTITVWVKGDIKASNAYDILSGVAKYEHKDKGWKHRVINGLTKSEHSFNGWKFDMQGNGAWRFTASGEEYTYEYAPMPFRQNIRDGHWHFLGVSYDKEAAELRFYYDGRQMAIYHVPELKDMMPADSLVIGNSADSEHDFRKKEWDSFYGQIDDITIYDCVLKTDEIAAYYHRVMGTVIPETEKYRPETLKVTAFNIFHGGHEKGKEVGRNRVIELLQDDGADIFTLVETYGSGEVIADALGYHLYLISSNLSIVSRYPITETYQIFKPFNSGGVQVELPDGQKLNIFAIWLKHLPNYKEMFLNPDLDLNEYLKEENKTRGSQMNAILQEVHPFLMEADTVPLLFAGDFNCGSHLDWTKATASQHHHYIFPWPVSKAAGKVGLVDSYRQVHPDPLEFPGITWSPMHRSKAYIKDRIDYIYYKGKMLKPVASTVIDQPAGRFPSDHAAVSTLFELD